jgi:molybdopterin molybdotransferase
MRSVEEQVQAARDLARPLESLDLTLGDAQGCVLAADVEAAYPVPAFPTATMDGYAVNAAMTVHVGADSCARSLGPGTSFDVVDWLRPGFTTDQPLSRTQAVHVRTGTMVPTCCTAVVSAGIDSAELVTGHSARRAIDVCSARDLCSVIDIRDVVEPGAGIALAGSYVAPEDVVLRAGTILTERAIAAAAAVGRSRVRAHPRPRVVIITVGDHLVEVDQAIVDGLVHDATGAMLVAAARSVGAMAFRGGPVQADPAAIGRALDDQCVRADLVVVLSAVADNGNQTENVVVQALRESGEPDIEHCGISPGTRIGLTTVGPDAVPVVTMDGLALSAFAGFEVIVRPMIAAMAGRGDVLRSVERAVVNSCVTDLPSVFTILAARTVPDPITGELRVEPMRELAHSASLWRIVLTQS